MIYLLDTNVISELVKPAPDPGVLKWAGALTSLAVSAVTLEELYFSLSARANPPLQVAIEKYLEAHATIIEVTAVIAKHAGVMRGQLARKGRVREQADMLIAATASTHGLTVVTRNERDFDGCGVAIYNPFR